MAWPLLGKPAATHQNLRGHFVAVLVSGVRRRLADPQLGDLLRADWFQEWETARLRVFFFPRVFRVWLGL